MGSEFVTTSWSQVLAARSGSSTESREALASLCQAYWYPLYAFVRRQGYDPDEARDLTQGYFAMLLERKYLDDFDPEVGRFRAFLKTSVKHFLSKERDRVRALKRGGRAEIVPLDPSDAETRYGHEPVDRTNPEEVFERQWALMVLERTMTRLRRELEDQGKSKEFEHLKNLLTGAEPRVPYQKLATELGTSEGAVKTSVHRLRRRFGELLRTEVAETVRSPEQVDDELRYLLGVLEPWEPKRA